MKNKFILIPSIQTLRKKIADSKGILKNLWEYTTEIAKVDPMEHPGQAVFYYLVSHDKRFKETAKASYLYWVLHKKAKDGYWKYPTNNKHYRGHTHICSAVAMYLSIYYDWLVNLGVLSKTDREKVKENLISSIYDFGFQHLKNQNMLYESKFLHDTGLTAMLNTDAALGCGCLYVGYIFGYKHDSDPRAQEMFKYCQTIFPDIIGKSPHGGYAGEGAVYTNYIQVPAFIFISALFEELTGKDIFNKKFYPNQVSVKNYVDLTIRLITPSGYAYPIDSHGVDVVSSIFPALYGFSKTSDLSYLRPFIDFRWWRCPMALWRPDPLIFSILFWPLSMRHVSLDEANNKIAWEGRSWCLPYSFASLEDKVRRVSLFQNWDISAPMPYPHSDVDPNSIFLEAYESLLILDGHPLGKPYVYRDKFKMFDGYEWREVDPGYAELGPHNTIIINKGDHYYPDEEKHGQAAYWRTTPFFDIISSEAAPVYQPKYALESFLRTTMFIKPDYFIIIDNLNSKKEHEYIWRLHLRMNGCRNGSVVDITTQEKVNLYIRPITDYRVRTKVIDLGGTCPEGKSYRLEYIKKGKRVGFTVLLRPEDLKEEIFDITREWNFKLAFQEAGEKGGWYKPDYRDNHWQKLPLDRAWFYCGVQGIGKTGWYRKKIFIPEQYKGKGIYLLLPRSGFFPKIWINGRKFNGKIVNTSIYKPFLNITPYLNKNSSNCIVISIRSTNYDAFYGGKAVLYASKAPSPQPSFTKLKENVLMVVSGRQKDYVICQHDPKILLKFNNIHTDARNGFIRSNLYKDHRIIKIGLVDVTKLKIEKDVFFKSSHPIDLSLAEKEIYLGRLLSENKLKIITPDLDIRLNYTDIIRIDGSLKEKVKMGVKLTEETIALINGRKARVNYDRDSNIQWIYLDSGSDKKRGAFHKQIKDLFIDLKSDESGRRVKAVISLGKSGKKEAIPFLLSLLKDSDFTVRSAVVKSLAALEAEQSIPHLIKALDDESWQVVTEAISAVGKLGGRQAIPRLIDLLTEQESGVIPFQAAAALARLGVKLKDKILNRPFKVWKNRNRAPLILELKKVIGNESSG